MIKEDSLSKVSQQQYEEVDMQDQVKGENFIQQTCQICYKIYHKINQQELRPALICYSCWFQHVKTNITKISYMVGAGIISPFQGAEQIDVCIALNGLKKNQKQELQEWLFKKYTTFTKDIEKCPSQTCDYVFTMERCKWMSNQDNKCPKCSIPLSVNSQQITLKSVIGLIYFIFLANKCPKCQIPIQRISGCPHMTCPCGHQFCWFCLKDHMHKQTNLYTVHEPKQCAFIFVSKIVIFITCLLSLSCFLVGGQTIRYVMECVFSVLGYIVHSVLIDLFLFGQWAVINFQRFQPYRRDPFQNWPKQMKVSFWIGVNALFIALLLGLELFYTTLAILVFQIGLVGFGALTVYSVIFSCDTWFEYIA